MASIQILAARMAGVETLYFYADRDAVATEAIHASTVAEIVDRIVALGYEWGTSDGN